VPPDAVFHCLQQLLADAAATRPVCDENARDLTGPRGQQAQAHAAQDPPVMAGDEQQAARRAQVIAGLRA